MDWFHTHNLMSESSPLPVADQWQKMSLEEKKQHAAELLQSVGPLIDDCRDKSADEVKLLLEKTTDPAEKQVLQIVQDMKEAGLG